ncbi:MAG TPA: AraC family transcriptional regulator [Gammaproteobacteria bacterium]|nr:AraC family transcriptional regulator [Gammaproteobacteria bacterium]
MSEKTEFDLLSNVLHSFRVAAHICRKGSFCGKWALDSTGFSGSIFHLIGRGAAWLHTDELETPIALRGGDLVMLPHGKWHQITGTPQREKRPTLTPEGASGPLTTVLCGLVTSTAGAFDPIIRVLPDILVVHAEDQGTSAQLHALARMMMSEYESGGTGGQAVLERLAEIMYVMIIRHYMQSQPQQRGLLAAIADPRLAGVLGAIHQDPGHDWQVQELADLAGMSRTAFAQKFSAMLELTPMQYVTHWRMHLAKDLLSDRRNTVTKIAEQLGYQTEAAFRRAFKRVSGSAPGKIRKQATAGA